MKRVIVYVDGFNLYHTIDAFSRKKLKLEGCSQEHLKWLSLKLLAEQLIQSRTEKITQVRHFSAIAEHLKSTRPDKVQRHLVYERTLKATGVVCTMGTFKKKQVWCNVCEAYRPSREEKETDVNLAIALLDDAYRDTNDSFFIVSTDTDFAPAIRLIRERFPDKEFVNIAGPGRPHAQALLALSDRSISITPGMLDRSRLPEKIETNDGRIIFCPSEYAIPTE